MVSQSGIKYVQYVHIPNQLLLRGCSEFPCTQVENMIYMYGWEEEERQTATVYSNPSLLYFIVIVALFHVQIVEYTTSADSDWDPLQQALEKAQTLCEHVNDGVQQKDNTEKLEWLQAHVQFVNLDEKIVFNSQTNFMGPRKLLHWGKFFKVHTFLVSLKIKE